jgi:DNA topoisomerase II
MVNKKNKNSAQVKPFQTKENMTLKVKSFGSKCNLSDDFIKKISKCGLVERINNWLAYKEKTDLEKAGSKSKVNKIKGIPKLDDAFTMS